MTYSANGVDDYVELLLPEIGYACDVGAALAGGSNSLMFEQKGWTVLAIDANPLLAEEGRKIRKLWESVACGAEDLDDQPYLVYGDFPHEAATGLKLYPGYEGYTGGPARHELRVNVRRLDGLLDKHAFPRLDYLCIDVEGHEREVLKGLTLERWRPVVIVMEDMAGTAEPPPGYRKVARQTHDNIYVRENVAA